MAGSAQRVRARFVQRGRSGPHPPIWVGEGEVHVWIAALDSPPIGFAPLEASLSASERERAGGIWYPAARRNFVTARGLLRVLLGWYLSLKPEQVRLTVNTAGKPALAGGEARSPIEFNLSHSADLGVFAIARGRDVGVDVERASPEFQLERVANRILSDRERESFERLKEADRATTFLTIWTRKEAYVKATGQGMTLPFHSIEATGTQLAGWPQALHVSEAEDPGPWWIESFTPAAGYIGALAVKGERPDVTYQRWLA